MVKRERRVWRMFCAVWSCVRTIEFLPSLGKKQQQIQGGEGCWSLGSRTVMFPLVSSQALTLEWIGLDMPEDLTSL